MMTENQQHGKSSLPVDQKAPSTSSQQIGNAPIPPTDEENTNHGMTTTTKKEIKGVEEVAANTNVNANMSDVTFSTSTVAVTTGTVSNNVTTENPDHHDPSTLQSDEEKKTTASSSVFSDSGCCGLLRHELSLAFFEPYIEKNETMISNDDRRSEEQADEDEEHHHHHQQQTSDYDENGTNDEGEQNRQQQIKKDLIRKQKYKGMFNTSTTNFSSIILPKAILLLLTILTLIWGWVITKTPSFFLAYWSHWILIYSALYQGLSLGLSLSQQMPSEWIMKLTWFVYSTAATHQITLVLIFWLMKFYDVDYFSFSYMMTHGGVMVTSLYQGFCIDSIPIRLKHYPAIASIAFLYVLWSIFHGLVLVHNPDSEELDGGVYHAVVWTDNIIGTLMLFFGIIFIVGPIAFSITWIMSIMIVKPETRKILSKICGSFITTTKSSFGPAHTRSSMHHKEESMMNTTVAVNDDDIEDSACQQEEEEESSTSDDGKTAESSLRVSSGSSDGDGDGDGDDSSNVVKIVVNV